MIDFTRSQLTHLATHYAGNFGLGEQLVLTDNLYEFKDDFVRGTFVHFLTQGFKNDVFYRFRKKHDILLYSIQKFSESMFKDNKTFLHQSKEIANHLYRQTMHPKIRGGELYVAYFKDIVCNGELCDAIGIFKTENKETFIKVDVNTSTVDIETDLGINPKKLDKGVLIFNLEQETGYKAVMIDNSKKIMDSAFYWSEDFLDMVLKESSYMHTRNQIDRSVDFCETVLSEENDVHKRDKMMVLNQAIKFLNEKENFDIAEFEKEVLRDEKMIDAYRQRSKEFNEIYNIAPVDTFSISSNAVKENQKLMKTTLKLDENFEITIKKNHQFLENGFDEAMGMKFYKLYYVNE